MRRRHLLALVILGLMLAMVVFVGPERIWDTLTLRAVVLTYPDGDTVHFQVPRWKRAIVSNAVGGWTRYGGDGAKTSTLRRLRDGRRELAVWEGRELRALYRLDESASRAWSDFVQEYRVRGAANIMEGVMWVDGGEGAQSQTWYRDGKVVERRTTPPWFTAQQIRQSVKRGEE